LDKVQNAGISANQEVFAQRLKVVADATLRDWFSAKLFRMEKPYNAGVFNPLSVYHRDKVVLFRISINDRGYRIKALASHQIVAVCRDQLNG
jgi:hypothetical protein